MPLLLFPSWIHLIQHTLHLQTPPQAQSSHPHSLRPRSRIPHLPAASTMTTNTNPMQTFLTKNLRPTSSCIVCTEPFSEDHIPVALPCTHIFGHSCIEKWLLGAENKVGTCPVCRRVVLPEDMEKRGNEREFSVEGIWGAFCEGYVEDQGQGQGNRGTGTATGGSGGNRREGGDSRTAVSVSEERIHIFMKKLWEGIQTLWKQAPTGIFTTTQILTKVLFPALVYTARLPSSTLGPGQSLFKDYRDLLIASWDSLGRPSHATGIAIPLVRLIHLMSDASCTLPKWLTTVPRMSMLFWKANACLAINADKMSWAILQDAALKHDERYFGVLHLYTVLLSQSIAHNPQPRVWPTRRHEVMNIVVERCCRKIGGLGWEGKPSNELKDVLVLVFEELRRRQLRNGAASLRGVEGEGRVVRAIWALACWDQKKGGSSSSSSEWTWES